jgi:hypothetical protein
MTVIAEETHLNAGRDCQAFPSNQRWLRRLHLYSQRSEHVDAWLALSGFNPLATALLLPLLIPGSVRDR